MLVFVLDTHPFKHRVLVSDRVVNQFIFGCVIPENVLFDLVHDGLFELQFIFVDEVVNKGGFQFGMDQLDAGWGHAVAAEMHAVQTLGPLQIHDQHQHVLFWQVHRRHIQMNQFRVFLDKCTKFGKSLLKYFVVVLSLIGLLDFSTHLNPSQVQVLDTSVLLEGFEKVPNEINGYLHPRNIDLFQS